MVCTVVYSKHVQFYSVLLLGILFYFQAICFMLILMLTLFQPFPVSIHKGWKLHSFQNCSRVWHQEISVNSSNANHNIYAAFNKVRVSPQVHVISSKNKTGLEIYCLQLYWMKAIRWVYDEGYLFNAKLALMLNRDNILDEFQG